MRWGTVDLHGEVYDYDVVVHTDGTVTKRKKKRSKHLKGEYGHTPLSRGELDLLITESPEVVYVGTGYEGALPITPDAREMLDAYSAVVAPTPEIVPLAEAEKRRFVAIIHVTC
ncbi:hypothetical protein CUJ86_03035 [Methanofollis fontis]|uniref:Uncharacterized protein n=2 Tax=Methanofollis fontis TaxID=2052832 RepID=A0A483CRV8_9EURY|nr:hypothetical protein CUJ86_03035 [Methanofollis fontis]